MRSLNEDTWFVIDGSDSVVRTTRGARVGEATADVIFMFLFGRVTKEVRSVINASRFWTELPLSSTGFLASLDGFDSTTDDAEVVYADDVMHAFTHKDAGFVAESVRCTASALVQVAGRHGLALNFGPGRTEAVLSLRGTSAKAIRENTLLRWRPSGRSRPVTCRLRIQTPWHLGHLYWLPHTGCCKKSRSRRGSICQVFRQVSFVCAFRCQAQAPCSWGCC